MGWVSRFPELNRVWGGYADGEIE